MFSGGCFATEEFSVDALPSRSSSLLADALLSRLLGRMLCRLEVIIYGYTSMLVTNVLNYFVLGSVAWVVMWRVFLAFVCVVNFVGNLWITCESIALVTCRSIGAPA
jgi:hypothetical protein